MSHCFRVCSFCWKVENVLIENMVGVFAFWYLFSSLEMFQSSKAGFFLYIRMMVSRNVTVLFGFVGQVLDLKRNLGINVMTEIKQ